MALSRNICFQFFCRLSTVQHLELPGFFRTALAEGHIHRSPKAIFIVAWAKGSGSDRRPRFAIGKRFVWLKAKLNPARGGKPAPVPHAVLGLSIQTPHPRRARRLGIANHHSIRRPRFPQPIVHGVTPNMRQTAWKRLNGTRGTWA